LLRILKTRIISRANAKRQAVINQKILFSVKDLLDLRKENSAEAKRLPYKVTKDSNENIKIKCPALSKEFSPEEISSSITKIN
jgi:molecular chaperone DnaK (HSP70)